MKPDVATHEGARHLTLQSGDRSTPHHALSEPIAGKASSSSTWREGRAISRCCRLPGRQKRRGTIFSSSKACRWQRAWHRCAASAVETERNKCCEGCWKTFCAPHLSLPKGLNLERGRGVEHVRERQRKGESSTP